MRGGHEICVKTIFNTHDARTHLCVPASSLEATGCRNNCAVKLETDTVVSQDEKKHPEELRSLLRRTYRHLCLKYEGGIWCFMHIWGAGKKNLKAAAAILLRVFKHIVSLNSQLTGEEKRMKVGQNKLVRLFKLYGPFMEEV